MKRLICLLLTAVMLLAAGIQGTAEDSAEGEAVPAIAQEEADGDDSVQIPLDEDDADGDDSEQIPVVIPEEAEGDGEEAVLELRELKTGDEGEDVRYLQMRLKDLQYFEYEADGVYGKSTENAVRRFQEDNANRGLEATGNADPATQMLAASTRYRGLRYGSSGEDVKELQTRLTELGYYKGKISGDYLEGTRNGISQFQKNNGLEETGVADPVTQETLYSFGAVGKYDVEEATPTPISDLSFYLVDENENAPVMPDEPVPYTKTLKSGTTKSALVKQLQERMQQLGYYDGPVSGNFMEKTLAAVKKIQTQNGMKATGTVDEDTWNLIFNNTRIVMPDATAKPTATPEPVPFAITVDVKNQIVSVYSRDENGEYTVPVRQMLCSTGKVGTPSPVGDWVLNGRKARWCYFPKWGDYARYWTRINSKVAFHSPIYYATSNSAIKEVSYKMLGSRASHGCVRLALEDAKWIYDNVTAGTVVSIREDLPVDKELKSVLMAEKPATSKGTKAEPTAEPPYNREEKPELKGAVLTEGSSKGDAVYWVQNRLKELGYYTTRCTGQFYNRTAQAVRDFQADHGFYQSGTVNQALIDAMAEAEKITPTPEPVPEAEPSVTPAP